MVALSVTFFRKFTHKYKGQSPDKIINNLIIKRFFLEIASHSFFKFFSSIYFFASLIKLQIMSIMIMPIGNALIILTL